jgi:accessory gene regulator
MIIEKLSNRVVQYLVHCNSIEDTEEYRDYYQYGVEITISSVLSVAAVLAIGILLHRFFASVLYFFLFMFIRRFTGGYHANTYFKCNITGCITFSSVILLSFLAEKYDGFKYLSFAFALISVLIIIIYCPVENKNKPIAPNKIKRYRILSVIIALVYCIIAGIALSVSQFYGYLILFTLSLTAMLVIIEKIKEMRFIHNEEQY